MDSSHTASRLEVFERERMNTLFNIIDSCVYPVQILSSCMKFGIVQVTDGLHKFYKFTNMTDYAVNLTSTLFNELVH